MRWIILLSLWAGSIFGQASFLGVGMQEVDAGVEVTAIVPDSPAEKAGLKVGDVVLKYNGQKVEGNEQFARLVRETPVGREVKIEFSRGGSTQTVLARMAPKKPDTMMSIPFEMHVPDLSRSVTALRSSALGIEAESVDGQLAQYFGVKEGVLVRSVMKSSAADKAGIKAGDVIVRLDDTRVATPGDISMRARSLHGKSAAVVLMRDHRELNLTITIGEDGPAGVIQITPFQVPQP